MEICRVKETPKAHILMMYFPQFIAFMNLPQGFTSEQVVEAQHACYDALYHRYRTSTVTSSTYPQRLLQSLLFSFWGVGWVENGDNWVVHELYITTNHVL